VLPPTVRVRISSDAAGAIALTPVVVQDLTITELLDHMLAVCGRDIERMRELLHRGSMVNGASRFRWEGFAADADDLGVALESLPGPDPSRPFNAALCYQAILRSGSHPLTIPREHADKRGLLRRRTLWDALIAPAGTATYANYSYREKADVYRVGLTADAQRALLEACRRSPFASLARQLESAPVLAIEYYVKRG
jgi:hypothetical protein